MSHPSEHPAVFVILAVATLAVVLVGTAMAAWTRSRNRRMLYLAGAFSVLAAKGLVTAGGLWFHGIRHEELELVGSLFDLALVGLLIAPLFHR